MYLIDETYFVGELSVPKNDSLDVIAQTNPLEVLIDKYSRLLLKNALGITLFNELDGHITDGVLNAENVPDKWNNLVTGTTYTNGGITKVWKGLLFTEGTFKGSVLAHYTYYHWLIKQMSQITNFGESKGQSVNALNVNDTTTSDHIWNQFIEMYQGRSTVLCSYSIKNGIPFYDYFSSKDNENVSLIQFLSDNDINYPNALLKEEKEGFRNHLGL